MNQKVTKEVPGTIDKPVQAKEFYTIISPVGNQYVVRTEALEHFKAVHEVTDEWKIK